MYLTIFLPTAKMLYQLTFQTLLGTEYKPSAFFRNLCDSCMNIEHASTLAPLMRALNRVKARFGEYRICLLCSLGPHFFQLNSLLGPYLSMGACYFQSKTTGIHKNYGIFEDNYFTTLILFECQMGAFYTINSLLLAGKSAFCYVINAICYVTRRLRRECYLPAPKIQQRCDKSASYFLLFHYH